MVRRRTSGLRRAYPGLLTSAQLAAAFLLTTLFSFPFAAEQAGPAPASAGAKDRVELVKLRTRTSRTFRNGNGTLTTALYSGSVNYRQPGRGWRAISSDVVPARRAGFAWKNEANAFQTFFRKRLDGEYLRFGLAGVNYGFTLEDAAVDTTAAARGERVSYRDSIAGVDLRYELFPDGLKETLVLPDRGAPTSYRFHMSAPAKPRSHAERQADGSWAIYLGARTRPLFVLEAPTAVDASGERGGAPELTVAHEKGGFGLELTLDEAWLRAPTRTFPVLLDPTITIQPSSQDASFNDACPTCTPYLDTKLYIGTTASERWRSAVQFNLGDVPAGAAVTDARLKLYYSGNCVPPADGACRPLTAKLDAHRMTSAWSATSTSGAIAYDATPASTLNFSTIADADVQWLTWDVTGTVKNWLAGTQTNYGLLLKRETEPLGASGPAPASRRYTTEVGLQPKLEVTYSGDGVDLLPPDTLHADGAELRWTRYTGPSGAPFDKYEVHRSATAKFTPSATTLLTTIRDQNVTSYRDTTAAPSKAFSYRVVANSSVSNERRVTLPGPGNSNKTLQPLPVDGTATYVDDAGARCTNHGAESDLWLGADSTAVRRALLQFDVRDIPATATVNGARLSVWRPYHAGVNAWLDAHNVTSAWREGSGSDACTGDGATWTETEAGVPWSTSGVDYDPTPARSLNSNNGATWNNFYIDPLVQEWVDGRTPNRGLLIKLQDETRVVGKRFRFYGDDFSVAPTLRPKLFVAYTDGSQAEGPAVSIAAPAGGGQVGGASVTVSAAAADDRRVDKVEFFVDGAATPFATDTAAPFEASWNSTTVANGPHSLTAKATDDAGNPTTSAATNVTVHNSALPTTSVSSPAAGATVTGTTTVSAAASDDLGLTKVEFYADDLLIAEDTTAPYSTTWNTLDQAQPSYDGGHVLTTKAYDTGGQVTTSPPRSVTAANTSGTKYKATFSSTEFPQAVIYDPAAITQEKSGIDVTVTNTSTASWSATDVFLRYRWESPDAPPVFTTGADLSLGTSLAAGATRTIRVLADPPALPDGVNKAQYKLRVDLYSKTNAAWFADKGNKPLENPVIVNKALVRGALGLEAYYHFVGEELGAGMRHEVNVANGNSLVRWTPFNAPGRGVDTILTLTHNALEKKCECPAGNNVSLGISSLTRFGHPIDIHPNKADEIAGRSNKYIEYTDDDGTTHRFNSVDGITYQEPDGVHLFLRRHSTTDATRKWAFTTPDGDTFFYDSEGYPTSVEDQNGNRLTYTLQQTPPGEDPGGPKKRITAVTDAGGRAFAISYYSKAEAKKAHVRGKINRVTDHSGSALDFEYYDDGNLRKLIQRGGTDADGSFLADRSFVFTYTTSSGDGPAIALAANRVDPDPKTPNQSTRLYSVRDPRGNETTFSYLGPGHGEDRWKLASRDDRAGATTTYGYDIGNRVTTVTLPLSRVWKYGYDVEGKVTTITNPLNQQTTQVWSGDRMLTKVIEPTGKFVERAYNANGLLTDSWDQLRNRTGYEYLNVAVDANDVSANWKVGRTIPHISRLKAETAPKGTATSTPATDYQTTYAYDAKGNVTTITDPAGFATSHTYNPDGTIATIIDPRGFATQLFDYDANGFATRIVDSRNGVTKQSFDADGQLLWIQDPLHANETGAAPREYRRYFDYDSFHRLGRESEPKSTTVERGMLIWSATVFDANDNVVAQIDTHYGAQYTGSGARTTLAYDAMDRQTLVTGPDRSVDPAGERTQTTYDAAGRVTQTTAPKGVMTPAPQDKDFALVYSYDGADRVVRETRYEQGASGAIARTLNTHTCYDLAGDIVRVTESNAGLGSVDCSAAPPSHTTRYAYNAAHQLTSTVNALGHQTSVVHDANGNVEKTIDELGRASTTVFDSRDLAVRQTSPFDSGATPARTITTAFEYDGNGNLTREISPRAWDTSLDKTTFTQYETSFRYDELGRLTRIDLPTSAAYPERQYVHRAYDANGNLTLTTLPATSADPALVLPEKKTTFSYYDTGDVRRSKSPLLRAFVYDYTASGQQSSRVPEKSDGTGDESERVSWSYTPGGLLRTMVDRAGQSASYSYDANGNLATALEARGLTGSRKSVDVELTNDAFDEVAKIRMREQGDPNWRFSTFVYDASGAPIASEESGVETGAGTLVTPGRKQDLLYDEVGNLLTEVDYGASTGAADDRRITSTYVADGGQQRSTVERPDGAGGWRTVATTDFTYWDDGNLRSLVRKNAAGTTVESHSLSYETGGIYANGQRTRDVFTLAGSGGGCATSCTIDYAYNPRDRLVRENVTRPTTSTDTRYTLDTTGNITSVDRNGVVTSYTYFGDQVQTRTRGDQTWKYFHDVDGNLDCITTGAGSRSDCNSPAGSTRSPNVVADNAYDYLNRLWSVRTFNPDGTRDRETDYAYDALSRVAEQTESHGPTGGPRRTTMSYVGTSTMLAEERALDGSGGLVSAKTFGFDADGEPIELSVAKGGSTTSYDYAYDAHGSVSALFDGTGAAKAAYGYGAYGDTDQQVTAGDADARDPINPIRYSAKRYDSGSATLDMGARRFDPADARFLQQDQFDAATGETALAADDANQNRYALAGGNPVNFLDDDGHASRPITVNSLYGGKEPKFHYFRIPFLHRHGIVRGGFFIRRCRALGLLAGDCRGFDGNAHPLQFRAFFRLNYRTGQGMMQVNPTCKYRSIIFARCARPNKIARHTWYGGSSIAFRRNFIDTSWEGPNWRTLRIKVSLAPAGNVARMLRAPAISANWRTIPTYPGRGNAWFLIRGRRDKFPSFELYQKLGPTCGIRLPALGYPNGGPCELTRTLCADGEAGGKSGPINLVGFQRGFRCYDSPILRG